MADRCETCLGVHADPSRSRFGPTAPGLRVEDYAVVASMARDIVGRAKEREWLDAMEYRDRELRALGYPQPEPLTEHERAEGRFYRLVLHVRRNP